MTTEVETLAGGEDQHIEAIDELSRREATRLEEGLQRVLSWDRSDPGLRVSKMQRLLGGSSREIWSCEVVTGAGERAVYVLRMDPGDSGRPSSLGLEGLAMRAAGEAGVPVPEVVMASDDPSILGRPFVLMSFVEGESNPRKILTDPSFEKARGQLAGQCAAALARIHSVPLSSVPGAPQVDMLEQLRAQLDQVGEPHPVFELALRFLASTRPDPRGPALVHGDFRNGNLIVGPEGLRAVIDWEMVHVGDPMEDLGWLCIRNWRFGGLNPVGGFGTYNQLIFGYEHAARVTFDRDVLRWWELACTVRWGVMSIIQGKSFEKEGKKNLERALIARRVCEAEFDTLILLSALMKRTI